MNLYFAPLACSLATRIALYEAGMPAQYTQVDLKAKQLLDGAADYFAVTPMGQVPALVLDSGAVLTENAVVLQYVADSFPQARLAPAAGMDRLRLQQWLGFLGTELHKAIFSPWFDAKAPDSVKSYAREKIPLRFGLLDRHLASREYLLDAFSVADAYLFVILVWAQAANVELAQWPAVQAYFQRLKQRPNVSRAFKEELALYKQEQARQAQPG